jgi:hypothetical protein
MSLSIDKISCYEKVWFEKQSQNKPNSKPIKANQSQFQAKTNPNKPNSNPRKTPYLTTE